jgi:hypothetical protein
MLETPKFTLFPQLPTEIRLQIWHAYFENSPSSARFCMVTSGRTKAREFTPFSIARPSARPLLQACRESREVALEHPFDPKIDILYVSDKAFESWAHNFLVPHSLSPHIRHLAITMGKWDKGRWTTGPLQSMPELRTISVVFPESRGRFDHEDAVQYPPITGGGTNVVLRKLSSKEQNAIKVTADYRVSGWFDDLLPRNDPDAGRIRWNKTGAQYLEHVDEKIRLQVRGDEPYWDAVKRELKLNFEARCLELA